jgi:NAD(P)-dependent dehydrogenase (short-subunit alcohol dehydrogenase family)
MKEQVVVVTGGTSGIGRAIAERFVLEGACVVIGSTEPASGDFPFGIEGASFVLTDVRKENDVERLIAATLERHGRLDIMVNNAGVSGVAGNISELPGDGVRDTQEVLFNGVVHGMKHAAQAMLQNGSGSIINIASITGLATYMNAAHIYSAMKAAVIQLTAALELGPRGIRVNCICPGYIATPIFGTHLGYQDEKRALSVEICKTLFRDLQPIRRSGLPEDIANAAKWLASTEASFVNGHALVVDGGASCGVGWDPGASRLGQLAAAIEAAERRP